MKIEYDEDACMGYANCVVEAPDLFDIDDDSGKAVVLVDAVTDAVADSARAAVRVCPARAIALEQ